MLNKLQKKALKFAYRVHKLNKSWHSFRPDKSTCDAIYGLHNCGLVKVNEYNQFKITNFGAYQYIYNIANISSKCFSKS